MQRINNNVYNNILFCKLVSCQFETCFILPRMVNVSYVLKMYYSYLPDLLFDEQQEDNIWLIEYVTVIKATRRWECTVMQGHINN